MRCAGPPPGGKKAWGGGAAVGEAGVTYDGGNHPSLPWQEPHHQAPSCPALARIGAPAGKESCDWRGSP